MLDAVGRATQWASLHMKGIDCISILLNYLKWLMYLNQSGSFLFDESFSPPPANCLQLICHSLISMATQVHRAILPPLQLDSMASCSVVMVDGLEWLVYLKLYEGTKAVMVFCSQLIIYCVKEKEESIFSIKAWSGSMLSWRQTV